MVEHSVLIHPTRQFPKNIIFHPKLKPIKNQIRKRHEQKIGDTKLNAEPQATSTTLANPTILIGVFCCFLISFTGFSAKEKGK
jgi:hypothetical protein